MQRLPIKIPGKLESIVLVSATVIVISIGIILISARTGTQSKPPMQARSQAPMTTPVQSAPQVNVVADFVKLLTQTQDIPLQSAVTPTPSFAPLPALYTELSTKGLVANIGNNSATIIWSTAAPQPTSFIYGATKTLITRKLSDDRGAKTTGYLHFVTLKNLTQQATYYFIGPSPITDSVTMPPVLPETTTKTTISGTLSGAQGECLVKATVLRGSTASTSVATPVTKDVWKLELQSVRDSGLSAYMNPLPTDTVKIDALCFGSGNNMFTTSQEVKLQQAQNQETFLIVKKQN